ncbi:MAG: class I SAM-dependent methyltransferase [Actinomycetota bacterium]|nr:class I SAM-dependent methyltransferase [Actinomycetota bacterium]
MALAGDHTELLEVLEQARSLGYLGPGPVEDHVRHGYGFVAAAGSDHRGRVIDLGSGGGVPGLILASAWPEATVVLLDASERRTQFLTTAVRLLNLDPARVRVVRARAEAVGRQDEWRRWSDLVVARGFGRPALVAECAAPLLVEGGRLIVSEPPEERPGRWPQAGLDQLGLVSTATVRHQGCWYQMLRQTGPCPDRFPRRPGIPAKRALF